MTKPKLNLKVLTLILPLMILFWACSDDNNDGDKIVPPSDIHVTAKSETSLTFSWSAVAGATGYTYMLNDSDNYKLYEETTPSTSVLFTGLTPGSSYRFKVKSNFDNGSSSYSEETTGRTDDEKDPDITIDPDFDPELPSHENDGLARAFPGAEGGGMYATGGRGGQVIHVTDLSDNMSNPAKGTLRWAVNQTGPRTIVFDKGGIIELKGNLTIRNNDITIAGQTAPGDGICIKDYPVVVNADNVILRFMRFRMGDEAGQENDALWGRFHKNIIIDHCSMSWSTDECSSFYANENFTMQWCILSESLRNSAHEKGTHGYAAIWGGVNASFHHNLLAHHDSRNPRFDGAEVYDTKDNPLKSDDRAVDFRNCVIYNFSNYPAYGGEGQKINFVGNYYKWGPASIGGPGKSYDSNVDDYINQNAKAREYIYFVSGVKSNTDWGCPHIYVGDNTNYLYTTAPFAKVNENNWAGMVYDSKNKGETEYTPLSSPVAIAPGGVAAKVTTHTAEVAFEEVLQYAGHSLVRDAVDSRAVNDTRTGTATVMAGSKYSINGYIDSQKDVGGWQNYAAGDVLIDSDGDGIPDFWEDMVGLDKNNAKDALLYSIDPRYTNLEIYLHWIVKDIVNGQAAKGTYTTLN